MSEDNKKQKEGHPSRSSKGGNKGNRNRNSGGRGGGRSGKPNRNRSGGQGGGSAATEYTPNTIQAKVLTPAQIAASSEAFGKLGLSEAQCLAAQKAGFFEPTPIQAATIPLAVEGTDVLGLARTGSGKTAAFTLPVIEKQGGPSAPAVVIVVPTRELAIQVDEQVRLLSNGIGTKAVAVFGGVSMEQQIALLKERVDIVVATPGRLVDLVERNYLSLAEVETVILDEADRMLDIGFSQQINTILNATVKRTQTLLFSATMLPSVERLARQHMKEAKRIDVNPNTVIAETVDQNFYELRLTARMPKLLELLRESKAADETVLIFCATKVNVDMLYKRLGEDGYLIERIHSGLHQEKRMKVLQKLRDGDIKVMVATDVAARGLDIPAIGHVINFEMPDSVEEYIHRVGRTGRYNSKGKASSLVTPEKFFMIPAVAQAMEKGRVATKEIPRARSFRPNRRR